MFGELFKTHGYVGAKKMGSMVTSC
uniref:Uncharacterized protein n=1 Tax=Arundo donax TaxID=35708 RepID=A0A0A9Q7C5_ARUDO